MCEQVWKRFISLPLSVWCEGNGVSADKLVILECNLHKRQRFACYENAQSASHTGTFNDPVIRDLGVMLCGFSLQQQQGENFHNSSEQYGERVQAAQLAAPTQKVKFLIFT